MKRLLRVVFLGPIFLIGLIAMSLVWPLVSFIDWLFDQPVEFDLGELWEEAIYAIWTGRDPMKRPM